MFGGNSNWRGPLWFPLNYLLVDVLERYYRFFGDDLTLEYPTGSGKQVTVDVIVRDLQDRPHLDLHRRRRRAPPCFGWVERLQQDPAWKDIPAVQRVLPRRQRRRPGRLRTRPDGPA